jgi:SH3-like domain-containing protein
MNMLQQMESLAAAGDWSELEDIVLRLRSTVLTVPEQDRRDVMIAMRRSTDKIARLATNARQEVTGRIASIRRGQAAAKAYDSSKTSYL